jgi:hypothetical protein
VCCPPIQSRPPYYFPPSYPDREASLFITLPGLLCLYACMRYIIQPQLPPTICFGEEGCLLFVHPTLSPVVVVFRLFWSVRVTGLKVFYSRPPYIYLCPHIIAFYYIIIAFKAFNFFFFLFARGLRPSCGAAMCNNTRSSSIHSAGYRLRFMYMSGREEKKGKKKEKKNKGVSD